jgi:hypothetical protein
MRVVVWSWNASWENFLRLIRDGMDLITGMIRDGANFIRRTIQDATNFIRKMIRDGINLIATVMVEFRFHIFYSLAASTSFRFYLSCGGYFLALSTIAFSTLFYFHCKTFRGACNRFMQRKWKVKTYNSNQFESNQFNSI